MNATVERCTITLRNLSCILDTPISDLILGVTMIGMIVGMFYFVSRVVRL